MKKLIIVNWKMHMSLDEAFKFCTKLTEQQYNNQLIIAPPIPYLAYLSDKFKSLEFCGQNVSRFVGQGSYTGEYSSLLLKLSKINYSIVGHSERRNFLQESNALIRQKAENCLESQVTPIICIGEDLAIRQNNNYKDFLLKQLEESLPNIVGEQNLIVAYEPIWAIGTGITPGQEELTEIFDALNYYLKQRQVANNISLVYGGSVNLDNIEKILSIQNIDGVMVGKSSLDYQMLVQMLNIANSNWHHC
ncbi:triose-phosphate isomerase [Rickettsia endosymbiont of Oedothorax gibbosus]|uniref:triose-phosphate isomerase n=1 Tax=Rickettsia endosymbiont of Oedothorax gibbosus TaxID=931099 RepID=UPI002025500F|nr:triose-phosphate isomerase family protein [Rickettsia endosymbiont of Oedothorax gibbosus]